MHDEIKTPIKTPNHFGPKRPFRITEDNVIAWKGKAGEPSRGVVVDGNGRFYPAGEPVRDQNAPFTSERKRLNAQIPNTEKSAMWRFQEETKALRRGGRVAR